MDGSIQIWNAVTGGAIGDVLCKHGGPVCCVSWSPDGTCIASGSSDKTVFVWNADTRERICGKLQGHSDVVWCVAWAEDGTRLASGSFDGTIRIWNVQTGEAEGDALSYWDHHAVSCVAWSPDGNHQAAGSNDGLVTIWDLRNGAAVAKVVNLDLFGMKVPIEPVSCVAWSPCGNIVASGSGNTYIFLHDAGKGLEIRPEGMWATIQEAEGQELNPYSASTIGMIKTGERVVCISWSYDGHYVASGSLDTVRLWCVVAVAKPGAVLSKKERPSMFIQIRQASEIFWSDNGKFVITTDLSFFARVWDASTFKCLQMTDFGGVGILQRLLDDYGVRSAGSVSGGGYSLVLYASEDEEMVLATLEAPAKWCYSEVSGKFAVSPATGGLHFLQLVK